ncbi:hypothetical protein BC830DRAFT_90481 [Chytriomyces sp. MP71]|nr:hypothetical protein BC830DRAFT_90481 [Chytriomyces sp. MP71]
MKSVKLRPPPVPPRPNQCTFLIPLKNRFCPLQVPASSSVQLCPNHNPNTNDRVPCPLDPSHSVATRDLAKHVKKCTASRSSGESRPFYSADINLPSTPRLSSTTPTTARDRLVQLPPDLFHALIAKIRAASAALVREPPTPSPTEEGLAAVFAEVPQTKSLRQIRALVSLLHAHGSGLRAGNVFVEMGCGQAELSQWVNTAVRTSEDGRGTPRFLLVDRAPSRWKVKEGEGLWEKLKVDIKDLQLDGCRWLDGTGEGLGKLICISKHL